jgi:hypothetical protein
MEDFSSGYVKGCNDNENPAANYNKQSHVAIYSSSSN